jgi:hypothetical protein
MTVDMPTLGTLNGCMAVDMHTVPNGYPFDS